jgi:hypothetical protein
MRPELVEPVLVALLEEGVQGVFVHGGDLLREW